MKTENEKLKVFITGVTGYLGGSVADKLIKNGYNVTGLVRTDDAAKIELLEKRGIQSIVGTLDDNEILTRAAQQADIVIHTANVDHVSSIYTLIAALEHSGKTLLTTTGSSIVADYADGEYAGSAFYDEDMHLNPVPFRRPRVDMNKYVRMAAIEKGIRTIVICPSMVYGEGKGLQSDSDQIPKLIGFSQQEGAGLYFGKGLNRYSNVFIDDLTDLYLLALEKASGGSLFYAENGHNSFKEIAALISNYLGFEGKTLSITIEHLIEFHGEADRLGVASNSLVNSVNARRIGWNPKGPSLEKYFSEITL
ncbi:NAD-dependent epimerase/dehydratase family protein [Chryseobacterium sp. JV274]|uniref:NAD-dependent epimerase/dehydratase family protein n=1 Tax=Chryseobacterium sp. JV274 TaxID=1932669 RepID=UPI0015C213C7|nr:NAD-dependent epimerase/dehydratase family protein [Chryseobacterium sp. JV274]CAD0218232.1 Nucleoside-diphosphate-sugar epimerases [Chryseobacterium sp. JV274]